MLDFLIHDKGNFLSLRNCWTISTIRLTVFSQSGLGGNKVRVAVDWICVTDRTKDLVVKNIPEERFYYNEMVHEICETVM